MCTQAKLQCNDTRGTRSPTQKTVTVGDPLLTLVFHCYWEWDQPKPRMYGRQDLSHLLDKMFPEDKVATAKEGHLRVFQLGKKPYNLIFFSMNT